MMKEKRNYEIKPLTKKDKHRLSSAVESQYIFVAFFIVIFSISIFVFLNSKASILFIAICILFILGIVWLVLAPLIKDIKRTRLAINKNEKHCGNGCSLQKNSILFYNYK